MKSVKQATYLSFCVVVGVWLEVLPELSLATAVTVHKEVPFDATNHVEMTTGPNHQYHPNRLADRRSIVVDEHLLESSFGKWA